MTDMIHRLFAVTVLAILVSILLAGCSGVGVIQHDSSFLRSVVGGCSLTVEDMPSGNVVLVYDEGKCRLFYSVGNLVGDSE